MYYPYFRGKQFELITIKETARIMANANIKPIIEPVKESLSSLKKAVQELIKENVSFTLIINPKHGELKNDNTPLFDEIIQPELLGYDKFQIGYIINSESSLVDIEDFIKEHGSYKIALIHYGFPKGKELKEAIEHASNVCAHIFIDKYSQKLYRRNFNKSRTIRVLIRDGFTKRRNADYPPQEHFTDLHITYEEEGMDGFGDFLIVGDEFSEAGGPAYAVAIHLTFIDKDDEEDMFIKHFVSDKTTTPVDPAGKFEEALSKLITCIREDDSKIYFSSSCDEFEKLFDEGHFPGLGSVKKLSMKHHIELIADFITK